MARVDDLSFLSFPVWMKVFFASTTLVLALAACATPAIPAEEGSLTQIAGETAGNVMVQTRNGLPGAAMAPLEDLNLRRDEIPPVLAAIDNPYAVSVDFSCDQIFREIAALDTVLEADADAPKPPPRAHTDVLAEEASDAALGAIKSTARGMIPFRGIVRKATGAEGHQKKRDEAFKLGSQRRAYLKGFALARDCPDPASHKPFAVPEPGPVIPPQADTGEETSEETGSNVIGDVIYGEDVQR